MLSVFKRPLYFFFLFFTEKRFVPISTSISPFNKTPVSKGVAIALSAQEALWRQLEASSHNLANAHSHGYKAIQINTQEHVYNTKNKDRVSYVKVGGALKNMTPGSLNKTNLNLNAAILGQGYFAVATPNGVRYTRDGFFMKNDQNQLVTSKGYTVLDDSFAPISLPKTSVGTHDDIYIRSDGTMFSEGKSFSKLGVFTLEDEQEAAENGDNLLYTKTPGTPQASPHVMQGVIEESNVSPVVESVRLVEIMRRYEQAQETINKTDEMKKRVVNVSSRNI